MNRSQLGVGVGVLAALAAATVAGERQASACGGCFTPPSQGVSDITDERMLLAVSPTQSTLYDQITYSGSPSNFAWVLPIKGTVQVGLSADVLFDSIAALTQTQIYPPPVSCPPPPNCNYGGGFGGAFAAADDAGGTAAPSVQVLVSQNVGPYQTVQLRSTDGTALDNWLAANGYNIPTAVQPILAAYNAEGFDFLAMKLLPGQGVQSMRPVRVTTPGASLSLPLRMASVGTGAITGITIWVVADGRYEPMNFPFFHIDDTDLVWDFSISSSNYTTLRTQHEADLKNAGWEIESSLNLNEQTITNVILNGGRYYGNGFGGGPAFVGYQTDAGADYLPVGSPDAGGDGGDGGGYEAADQVRADDIAALFAGLSGPTVRVTRMRSDIAQTAMTKDFVLTASSDQSEVSNIHNLTKSVNQTCPVYNGCNYVGNGTPAQAAATADGGYVASSGPDGGVILTPTGTKGGGCTTSPGDSGSGIRLGLIAGMLGLIAARVVRARRRG